ncbi:MAG: LamG-like jellyroll fold domain-containing protein, partial [Bacteroidota bacterium]
LLILPQQTNLNQQATIRVSLTDLLEIPIDFQDQAFQIAEDAPNLRFIGRLTITFPDSIPVSYRWVDPPADLPFILDSDGDLLVNNPSSLDYERQSLYQLVVAVEADDYPEANAQASVTIQLKNVSERLLLLDYAFEGNGQNRAAFGNELSFTGEGVAFATGFRQQGLSLTGGSGELSDVRIFDGLGSFTMGGWIQPTQITGRNRAIMAKTSPDRDLVLMINSDGRLNAHFTDQSGFVHRFSVATIATNQWTHVAATWDGSAWNLYINGQLSSSTGTNPQGRKPQWVSQEMTIGALPTGGDVFMGLLDELRFYDYALTEAEIAQWHSE